MDARQFNEDPRHRRHAEIEHGHIKSPGAFLVMVQRC
jgi:hypothetical protein